MGGGAGNPVGRVTHSLRQQHPHGLKGASERVEDQSQDLQGHDAEQGLVARLPENDRRVPVPLRQADMGFGNLTLNGGAIGKRAAYGSPGR